MVRYSFNLVEPNGGFFIGVDNLGRRGRGNCFDHLTWMEGSFFSKLGTLGSGSKQVNQEAVENV